MAHVLVSELRKALLQKAFSGGLDLSDESDTPIGKTLNDIIEFKKKNKIKDPKYDATFNDDIFDIPEKWEWVKLPQIAISGLGKTLNASKDIGEEKPYLCSINVYWSGLSLSTIKKAKFSQSDIEKYRLQKGDMLICEGGDVGKTVIWENDDEMYYQNALHRVRFFGEVNQYYMRYLLMFYKWTGLLDDSSKGMTIKHLVQGALNALPIPLPPIEEQARIVARVDELMAEIDEYEKIENQLVELKKNFPGDMKTAVLQAAMQGKLTEQLSSDSIVGISQELFNSNKKYALPNNNEYELPETWECLRISDVLDIVNGFTPLRTNPNFWNSKDIPWFTIEDVRKQGRFINRTEQFISKNALGKDSKRILPKDSILICCTASIGEFAYANIELTTNQQFNGLIRKSFVVGKINPMYLYYFTQTLKNKLIDKSGSTTFNFLSTKKLGEFLLPVPPIEEQRRIVEKLDQLLPLCESLEL